MAICRSFVSIWVLLLLFLLLLLLLLLLSSLIYATAAPGARAAPASPYKNILHTAGNGSRCAETQKKKKKGTRNQTAAERGTAQNQGL